MNKLEVNLLCLKILNYLLILINTNIEIFKTIEMYYVIININI